MDSINLVDITRLLKLLFENVIIPDFNKTMFLKSLYILNRCVLEVEKKGKVFDLNPTRLRYMTRADFNEDLKKIKEEWKTASQYINSLEDEKKVSNFIGNLEKRIKNLKNIQAVRPIKTGPSIG